jgi:hypothetical protein
MMNAVLLTAIVSLFMTAGLEGGAAASSTPTLVFSVPGVINGTYLSTFFSCTSTSTASQTVAVNVFAADGSPTGSGSLSVSPNATVLIGTGLYDAAGLGEDLFVTTSGFRVGSAQILSTSRSSITCAAFIAETAHNPPSVMVTLPVIVKAKQRGA